MIELKPFTQNDFPLLISWINSEEALMQFAGLNFAFPLTEEQLAANVAHPKITAFKAVHEEQENIIGHGEIYLTDDGEAILGKIIIGDAALRGKGFGQQIVQQLLEIAFAELKVETVLLYVFDWNISAIKCYEKVGFAVEKGGSKKRYINGKTWTAIKMMLSIESWMALKKPG